MIRNVKLINLGILDTNYEKVIDFENEENRDLFFNEFTYKSFQINTKVGDNVNSITIPKAIEEIEIYDYLIIETDIKKYYYFIISKEELNINNTTCFLQLDVFTTHQFDIELQQSFVERCHVDRWEIDGTPTKNLIDEGLDYGETIQIGNKETIYKLTDSVLIASTVPIGYMEKLTGGTPTPQPPGTEEDGDWEKGILSANGFRFIKGWEGFAPRKYQDLAGYWTIAYGVTKHGEPTIYEDLVKKEPIQESEGAKISYKLKNDNYGKKIVDKLKKYGITKQREFDALVSFSFNLGIGVVLDENSKMSKALKSGDRTNIENAFNAYVYSGGNVVNGLVLRRKEEIKMFFGEKYQIRPISLIDSNGNYKGQVTENNGNGWLPTTVEPPSTNHPKVENEGGTMSMSTYGRVTATFPTYPNGEKHNGVDIAPPIVGGFAETFAMRKGKVIWAGMRPNGSGGLETYGNYVDIDHGGGIMTRYAHHKELYVKTGDNVEEGQKLGVQGTTGNSSGVHLHTELHINGVRKNPYPKLKVGDVIQKW